MLMKTDNNRNGMGTLSSQSAYTVSMLSSKQYRELTRETNWTSKMVDGFLNLFYVSHYRVAEVECFLRQILESTGFIELPDSRMQVKTGLTERP
jgi:hypothetical protein